MSPQHPTPPKNVKSDVLARRPSASKCTVSASQVANFVVMIVDVSIAKICQALKMSSAMPKWVSRKAVAAIANFQKKDAIARNHIVSNATVSAITQV